MASSKKLRRTAKPKALRRKQLTLDQRKLDHAKRWLDQRIVRMNGTGSGAIA